MAKSESSNGVLGVVMVVIVALVIIMSMLIKQNNTKVIQKNQTTKDVPISTTDREREIQTE